MIVTIQDFRSAGMSKDGNPVKRIVRIKLFGFITIFKKVIHYKDGGQI